MSSKSLLRNANNALKRWALPPAKTRKKRIIALSASDVETEVASNDEVEQEESQQHPRAKTKVTEPVT